MKNKIDERLELEARCCGMTIEEYVERIIYLTKQRLLLPHIAFIQIPSVKGREGLRGEE